MLVSVRRASPAGSRGSEFDLSLSLRGGAGAGATAQLEYSLDLFSEHHADRILSHWLRLLDGLCEEPARPVSRIPFLDDAERRAVIEGGLDADPASPFVSVAAQVDEVVRSQPDRLAISDAWRELTYRQLDALTRRVAAALRGRGISNGARVGLMLQRSVAIAPCLLATQRLGAAYVPLDPGYPPARLREMIERSELSALICDVDHEFGEVVDTIDFGSLPDTEEETPRASVGPEDVAYLIYTSGSTGSPKGVAVTHGGLSNVVESFAETVDLTAQDTVLAVTSLSFDIAALEFFMPLTRGAHVSVAGSDELHNPELLASRIESADVSVIQSTPSLWRSILRGEWSGWVRGLVGGEPLAPELAEALVGRLQGAWNCYGPTETTVWSSVQRLSSPVPDPVPIGKPVSGTRLYVLDEHRQLVPVGVPGELYIAGTGLARGYAGDPRQTEERFVADPFVEGERMYRTGDLARINDEGIFEFLGRIDNQLKIRGYRIEPGEIESHLRAMPEVAAAAVVSQETDGDSPRLVAFVEANNQGLDVDRVRARLRDALPPYLVPELITTLDDWPMTPNGKVNRRALSELRVQVAEVSALAPRTATEASLLAIFEECLEVDGLGVNANFFESGGDSLRVLAAVSRANDAGLPLKPRDVFERQSVEGLAPVVEARLTSATSV